jgi:hypothetical protein
MRTWAVGMVAIIAVAQQAKSRRMWFKASPGKKLVRFHPSQ